MTDQLKRKRSKIACEPCRARKRKCNGETSCSTCSDWGYTCHYDHTPTSEKKQKRRNTLPPISPVASSEPTPRNDSSYQRPAPADTAYRPAPADPQSVTRSLEANSGAAFVRKLALKVDSANAPKLSLFGWNTGERLLPSGLGSVSALPIVDVLSVADMRALAGVYFAKVDPCYGFIDAGVFYEHLEMRWQAPLVRGVYDSVLAGVAALGSLFSHKVVDITELLLVESARAALEIGDRCGAPSIDTVTAWVLRVVYMRMTASPHSTWIASSTLMHLIEALGLHQESTSETVLSRRVPCTTDIRRRIVGVAQHLNMWVSYDLGLSRVIFPNEGCLSPSPKPGDYTAELLNLLPVSASLDPEKAQDDRDLESSLLRTLDGTHTAPPSVMGQCNLVLCLLRRILVTNVTTSQSTKEKTLLLFKKALHGARTMALNCSPWHHVANVPFQIISVLLDMDTRASLAVLPEAMQTLKLVAATYETDTMREAYSTAYLLVLLHQQRRCEDVELLSGLVNVNHQTGPDVSVGEASAAQEFSWLEGLVDDMPSLQGINLYGSLEAGMADLDGFHVDSAYGLNDFVS